MVKALGQARLSPPTVEMIRVNEFGSPFMPERKKTEMMLKLQWYVKDMLKRIFELVVKMVHFFLHLLPKLRLIDG